MLQIFYPESDQTSKSGVGQHVRLRCTLHFAIVEMASNLASLTDATQKKKKKG